MAENEGTESTEGAEPEEQRDAPDLGDAGTRALKAERARAKAAEKALADQTKRLKEYEDRDKTEAQKLAERAEAAEKSLTPLQQENTRLRVGMKHGVPEDFIDRLKGDTVEELEEDAKSLVKRLQPGRPKGSVDQGQRGKPGEQFNGNDFLRDLARR